MKKLKQTQKRRSAICHGAENRRGAAIVEFALVMPLFLTLLLGTWEMSQAVDASHVMSSAIREGGRLAAMDWEGVVPDGTTANEKITTDILNFIKASNLPSEDVTISITHAEGANEGQPFDLSDTDNTLELFKIDVSLPYNSITTFPLHYMENENVTASLVFRSGRVTIIN